MAGVIILRALGVVLVLLPFAPPIAWYLGDHGGALEVVGDVVDRGLAPFCHRLPERCLQILGVPMPLCSRCLGLVVGLGGGLAIARPSLELRPFLLTVAVAGAFLAGELITQDLGLHDVFHPTRLLSGLLLAYPIGSTAAALLVKSSATNWTSVQGNR